MGITKSGGEQIIWKTHFCCIALLQLKSILAIFISKKTTKNSSTGKGIWSEGLIAVEGTVQRNYNLDKAKIGQNYIFYKKLAEKSCLKSSRQAHTIAALILSYLECGIFSTPCTNLCHIRESKCSVIYYFKMTIWDPYNITVCGHTPLYATKDTSWFLYIMGSHDG